MIITNQRIHGSDNQFLCKWSNLLDCDYINQSIQCTESQFMLGVEKQQTDTVGIKNQSTCVFTLTKAQCMIYSIYEMLYVTKQQSLPVFTITSTVALLRTVLQRLNYLFKASK